VEADTRLAIEKRKYREMSKKKISIMLESERYENPLYEKLIQKMVFKTWLNYTYKK